MAVDREIANILCMCTQVCDLMCSLGCLSTFFSCPEGDFGVPLGPFGQPLDHFGAPWVAVEVALVCLGRYGRFLRKLDVRFGQKPITSSLADQGGLHGNRRGPKVVQGLPKGTQKEPKVSPRTAKGCPETPKRATNHKTISTYTKYTQAADPPP